jgi:hypothetical protein
LQVVDAEVVALATMENAPDAVLREAHAAAKALQDVISKKSKKVMMNGEQYLEFEDWQTLGRFYGITGMVDGEPEFVSLGDVQGFKASAVALHKGQVISRASAYCLSDEEKWGTRPKYAYAYCLKSGGTSVEDPGMSEIVWVDNPSKPGKSMPKKEKVRVGDESVPLFQLASMAQTRALAKVHRNILSWVVVLAGYKPTPAEELEGLTSVEPQAPPTPPPAREPGEDDGPPPEPERKAAEAPRPSGDRLPCPKCKKLVGPSKFPKPNASHFCMTCREGFSK